MIEIRLFATFREGREKISYLEPETVSTAGEAVDFYGIPREEVAICLINGRHAPLDAALKDQDVLALFPPVGGG
ncbi:MAG: MoaD/ThiS family protein [Eubacteriales bacterium]|nr:MoaD/ThiS family protein [Eubacteriales bacterium]